MRRTNAERVRELLTRISNAYPDDPGTSDLDDEQPIYNVLTLGDLRLCKQVLRDENFVIGQELTRPILEVYARSNGELVATCEQLNKTIVGGK